MQPQTPSAPTGAPQHAGPPKPEIPDILEYGGVKNGAKQSTNRRLFMQLQVFTGCTDTAPVIEALKKSGLECVLYADVNDARGFGLLFMSEDPSLFTGAVRKLLNAAPFSSFIARPEMTMLGRSYSTGFEQDLEDWLLQKPRRNVFDPAHKWAIWYPLRRKGEFEALSKEEQRPILMEHAKIGMGYGAGEFAHDVRLACHGLDGNDNEFVLGVVGRELYPLSRLIQDMRKTQQTSKYIQAMGPFFVAQVLWAQKSS